VCSLESGELIQLCALLLYVVSLCHTCQSDAVLHLWLVTHST